MKSNYNQLGQYIEMVSRTNSDLKYGIEDVRGCSNTKQMMQTRANLIGRTYEKFIVLRPQEFVFNRRTTRNGEKIGMAYNNTDREYIFTNDYVAFRVKQEYLDKLLPDYLYMFFCRDEFDRYARYKSTGSATEFFNWEDMCAVPFEIPPMDFQQLVVNAYKVLNERIETKQKINDNLVAVGTASIQKNVGRGALINLTEAEMDSLIFPEDFKIKTVSEFCAETKSGSTPSRTNNEYWENGTISWVKSGEVHNNITLQTEEYITSLGLSESSTKLLPKDTVLMAMYGVTAGEVGYLAIEATTNQAICGMICRSKAEAAYLYFSLIQSQAAISRLSNGGAQDNLSKNFIDNIKIVVPPSEFIEKLNLAAIVEQMTLNTKEITLLEELQATVLAQLSSR